MDKMLHISYRLPFVYLQETRKICKIHNESFHMCFKPIKHCDKPKCNCHRVFEISQG